MSNEKRQNKHPRRQFSLRSLLLFAVGAGLTIGWVGTRYFTDIYDGVDYNRMVGIGGIDSTQSARVKQLLDDHRIPNFSEGSVVYGVSVLPEHADEAKAILHQDAKKQGYNFYSLEVASDDEAKT